MRLEVLSSLTLRISDTVRVVYRVTYHRSQTTYFLTFGSYEEDVLRVVGTDTSTIIVLTEDTSPTILRPLKGPPRRVHRLPKTSYFQVVLTGVYKSSVKIPSQVSDRKTGDLL